MYSEKILEEIAAAILSVTQEDVSKFAEMLQKANRVFGDGLGRSGLCCRGFIMRLMHLGLESFFVGETVTPAIAKGDLLLICSGSGESETLLSHAKKAKENKAWITLVTGKRDSPIGKLADIQIIIDAPQKGREENRTIMPMGSLFEGAAALLFENVVLELMIEKNETGKSMFQRHANLE